MTTATRAPGTAARAGEPEEITPGTTVRLVPPARTPAAVPAIGGTGTGSGGRSPARPDRNRTVRSWPLLILALPAAVAVWSGWVQIGQLTGFGQVHPLPGIWDSLHLNTAVTLPVGVEAYAAYALRAWLTTSTAVSARTRRFARRSATGSLLLGMAGQAAYHLMAQARITRAPWPVTTAVSCLPVLVLGTGAALAHLLHADARGTSQPRQARSQCPDQPRDHTDHHDADPDHTTGSTRPDRLARAQLTAARLAGTGQRISRRTLRAAGLHGSNADLGALAFLLRSQPPAGSPSHQTPDGGLAAHSARAGARPAGWRL